MYNSRIFFSIIIPTYNRAGTLPKAISSVLEQTFSDFEIIVVDDGSTDNTEEVVEGIQDNRIRYFKKVNEERNIARNFGIDKAQGKYIGFLDSDDYYYPNHLKVAYNLIKSKSAKVMHLGYEVKDSNDKLIAVKNDIRKNINPYLIQDNVFSCNGVIVENDLLKGIKFIHSKTAITSEDHCLWLRLAARHPIHIDNTITSVICEHNERSLRQINPDIYCAGTLEIIAELLQDDTFMDAYGKDLSMFIAKKYSFIALVYMMNNQEKEARHYLALSFQKNPAVFFTKRFLAVTKKLIAQASLV